MGPEKTLRTEGGAARVGKEKDVWWCDKIFDVTALWEFFVKERVYSAVACPCWMLTRDAETL